MTQPRNFFISFIPMDLPLSYQVLSYPITSCRNFENKLLSEEDIVPLDTAQILG